MKGCRSLRFRVKQGLKFGQRGFPYVERLMLNVYVYLKLYQALRRRFPQVKSLHACMIRLYHVISSYEGEVCLCNESSRLHDTSISRYIKF